MNSRHFLSLFLLLMLVLLGQLPGILHASGTGHDRGLQLTVDRYNSVWSKLSVDAGTNVAALLDFLQRSVIGKEVLQKATIKAQAQGRRIEEVVKVGDGSATDTTLIRKFSKSQPEIMSFEMKYEIYINSNLNVLDAVLDLVHELTHYAYRDLFNPYLSNFNLKTFIHSTMEGEGGEVDAFLMECNVLKELFSDLALKQSHCSEIFDRSTGTFSRQMTVKKFYAIGSLKRNFFEEIKALRAEQSDFPLISGADAIFISSAYSLPYPVAAVREYRSIMLRVCKNDEQRILYMQTKLQNTSQNLKNIKQKELNTMMETYFLRCENIDY